MTQRGKETSLQSPSGPGAEREGASPARTGPPSLRDVRAVKMQPTTSAAKVSCKSEPDAARGEESLHVLLGADLPPGLTAPLRAAFSQHPSICMKRKSNACLGLDRTAELRAIQCPLLKDITLSR